MCPGFELGVWREDALVRDVFDRHLISFASRYSDFKQVDADSAPEMLRNAAKSIYQTDKYGRRGEFGELFLHAILRDVFRSEPAISKLYFTDGPNETVKGFDAVHIVTIEDDIELWLGEVKYYKSVTKAIADVTNELALHLDAGYLRGEFIAVVRKIDPQWPYAERLSRLLDENTSLDEIFDAVTVPILLTYDSTTVAKNTKLCDDYVHALRDETEAAWQKLCDKVSPEWRVRLRLILMPLKSKESLTLKMHEKLVIWQSI
jgi:hypothetical protein